MWDSVCLCAVMKLTKGSVVLWRVVCADADAHTKDLAPVIAELQRQGHTSLRAMAAELNARGVLTRRGGLWHVSTVRNLLGRIATNSDCRS